MCPSENSLCMVTGKVYKKRTNERVENIVLHVLARRSEEAYGLMVDCKQWERKYKNVPIQGDLHKSSYLKTERKRMTS